MQRHQPEITRLPRQRKIIPSWVRWALVLIAIVLITAGTILGIIQGNFTGTLFLILSAFGVIVALLQGLLPVSHGVSPSVSSTPPIHPPPAPLPTTIAYRGVLSVAPPTDPSTIQQREHVFSDIYKKLTQPGTTPIALTGIGGIGKSSLAALIYRYAEEKRHTDCGPFKDEAL